MSSYNRCIFMGNLTRDPELRKTKSGFSVAEFTLAINAGYTDKDGKKHDLVDFLDFTVWGKRAEVICQYKRKGEVLHVEARAQQEKWVDEKSGKNRSRIRFVADDVQFVGSKRQENDAEKREMDRSAKRDEREKEADGKPDYDDSDVPPEHRPGADNQTTAAAGAAGGR